MKRLVHRGSSIAYHRFGDQRPDGFMLVFLPGWACTAAGWHPVARALADRWPSLTVDLAGFGLSEAGTRAEWTLAALGCDIAAVLSAEQIDHAILVGHSMGGAVALEVARLAPDRVAAVIGADCFIYPELYDAVPEQVAEQTLEPLKADFREAVRGFLEPYIVPGPGEEAARAQVGIMMDAEPSVAIAVMTDFLRWDLSRALGDIQRPVAVIGSTSLGQKDASAPWRDGVKFSWMDDVGHFVMVENPGVFCKHLADVLEALT